MTETVATARCPCGESVRREEVDVHIKRILDGVYAAVDPETEHACVAINVALQLLAYTRYVHTKCQVLFTPEEFDGYVDRTYAMTRRVFESEEYDQAHCGAVGEHKHGERRLRAFKKLGAN